MSGVWSLSSLLCCAALVAAAPFAEFAALRAVLTTAGCNASSTCPLRDVTAQSDCASFGAVAACDAAGRLTGLTLTMFPLYGTLSTAIGALTSLRSLYEERRRRFVFAVFLALNNAQPRASSAQAKIPHQRGAHVDDSERDRAIVVADLSVSGADDGRKALRLCD